MQRLGLGQLWLPLYNVHLCETPLLPTLSTFLNNVPTVLDIVTALFFLISFPPEIRDFSRPKSAVSGNLGNIRTIVSYLG